MGPERLRRTAETLLSFIESLDHLDSLEYLDFLDHLDYLDYLENLDHLEKPESQYPIDHSPTEYKKHPAVYLRDAFLCLRIEASVSAPIALRAFYHLRYKCRGV